MTAKTGEIKRTDEARFASLPDFSYLPCYIGDLVDGSRLRMAYIDEGPKDAKHVFLCLHGEPTWSFLYRHMIPIFLASGARVIAPDLFGFGRSDKPSDDECYTFGFHRNTLLAFVDRLDLTDLTLVVQDWGGLLGLTLPLDAGFEPRLKRLLIMNTTIATGKPASDGFDAWRRYAANNPDLPVGELMHRSCPHLSDAEVGAFDAPFPDASYKAGVRAFPAIVPTEPRMEGADFGSRAVAYWRDRWHGKSFMAYGAADPVFPPVMMEQLRQTIRNCPEALVVEDGGHFVQEWGTEIAVAALRHWRDAHGA